MTEKTQNEATAEIYRVLPLVMKDIGAIGKDRENRDQHFKFRGIDDVYNAVQPAFTKHGVFIVPNVEACEQSDRQTSTGKTQIHTLIRGTFTFYANDGSSVVARVAAEGLDMSDKSVNKAMSQAMKYALFQVLCIPTEDEDADATSPEAGKPATTRTPAASGNAPAKPTPPANERRREGDKPALPADGKITEGKAKRLWAICKELGVSEEQLREIVARVAQVEHLRDIHFKRYKDVEEAIRAEAAAGNEGGREPDEAPVEAGDEHGAMSDLPW